MSVRFPPGAAAYAKDGRRYVVDEVAGGTAYCTAPGGAETEFPEAQLMTEAEWTARGGNRRDLIYAKIKQARAYAPYKGALERAASEHLLKRAEQLFPGLLDFTAFSVASRALDESGDRTLIPDLSIVKCRELFESATPQTRATLLAGLVGAVPEKIVGGARLGDNLTRAMIEKGLDAQAFDSFGSRRRQ